MKISKKVLSFRSLVTNTVIPKAFTDMIRNDTTLFWSKPYGTSSDFHEAFHSPKTSKALRYVMAASGILGEENALNRSLSGLRSDLHFKVEPQYVQKRGRIKLSHFDVKGYTQSGHGKILKLNNTAKKMMMGTPIYPGRANMAIVAIKGRGGRGRSWQSYHQARMAQAPLQGDPLIAEAQEQQTDHLGELIKQKLEEGDKPKKPRKARKKETKPRERKPKPRKLTAVERARILRAITEILNHLQGIMWILHYTIKLNDRRRQFLYLDDDFVWVADPARRNVRLDLYGFPEHMEHYIHQHISYGEWFEFFVLKSPADQLLTKMKEVCEHGKRIDNQYYENEEDEQDALDELLHDCSETLRMTTEFYHRMERTIWIFSIKIIPKIHEVPKRVPKHRRHTKKNKMFKPKKTREGVRMQVSYYESLHSDYWNNIKDD